MNRQVRLGEQIERGDAVSGRAKGMLLRWSQNMQLHGVDDAATVLVDHAEITQRRGITTMSIDDPLATGAGDRSGWITGRIHDVSGRLHEPDVGNGGGADADRAAASGV